MTIVKIQRPLGSTDPEPKYLVYSQDRSIYALLPDVPAVAALFRGGAMKVYHHAELEFDGTLRIEQRAPDQDW